MTKSVFKGYSGLNKLNSSGQNDKFRFKHNTHSNVIFIQKQYY